MQKIILIFSIFLFISCSKEPPLDPDPTLSGSSNYFDSIITVANNSWLFIYRNDFELIKTDIYNKASEKLLNIKELTSSQEAKLIGDAISPDGKKILLYYYNSRSSQTNEIEGKCILYYFLSKRIEYLQTDYDVFSLDWIESAHWLDTNNFIIPIKKYEYEDSAWIPSVKLLKYSLNDSLVPEIINLGYSEPMFEWMANSNTLLFANKALPSDSLKIKAVDINGVRPAKQSEISYFKKPQHQRADLGLVPLDPKLHIDLKIDLVDEFDEKYLNWEYLYLNNKIVRCSKDLIEKYPVFDNDLGLIIWNEGGSIGANYFMDKKGHYRFWFTGSLCGKIARN